MAEPWLELVQTIQDVPAPAELRQEILRRQALLQSDATGKPVTQSDPAGRRRWVRRGGHLPRAAAVLAAIAGVTAVLAILALAAHSRENASTPAGRGGPTTVTLVGQRGIWDTNHVARWRTLRQATVTCGSRPTITSTGGNSGVRPSDLCSALAYYAAHSTQSRCSYASIIGPVNPIRVLITGSIAGRAVHLNMGMICNPPAQLGSATGLIDGIAFGINAAVPGSISEHTIHKLTQMAKTDTRSLGDPRVHSAELVLTTRHRMNQALGIGYQASEDQSAKVFVIQLRGTFACAECSRPPEASTPTGSAAQYVLTYESLTQSDFGLTHHPVAMQGMGPVMHLTWR